MLKNLLGIRSARQMNQFEQRELVRTMQSALHAYGREHRFTADDVRQLHRSWLGRIYVWAGEYRQVNVSKDGFLFAAAGRVGALMEEFEANVLARCTPMRGGDLATSVAMLAEVHTELLLIHPFRDGNGRVARLLATLMALQAGISEPSFEGVFYRRRKEYFAAVRAGLDRNYESMRALFAEALAQRRP